MQVAQGVGGGGGGEKGWEGEERGSTCSWEMGSGTSATRSLEASSRSRKLRSMPACSTIFTNRCSMPVSSVSCTAHATSAFWYRRGVVP